MGSVLFHVGVLIIFFGHLAGLLTPLWFFELVGISHGFKQWLAIIVGGLGAILALTGGGMLLHRRLTDPRIRATSSFADIGILVLLLAQLVLGVLTITVSLQHLDGGEMVNFMTWSQGIFTFRTDAWEIRRGRQHPLQAAHLPRPDDLPALSVHPPRAHAVGAGALPLAPGLPDRPHPPPPAARGRIGAQVPCRVAAHEDAAPARRRDQR